QDALALHGSHRARAGGVADELPAALEPRAVVQARHLAAGSPRAGLHLRLALPLAGERVELLRLRTGLRGGLLLCHRECRGKPEGEHRCENPRSHDVLLTRRILCLGRRAEGAFRRTAEGAVCRVYARRMRLHRIALAAASALVLASPGFAAEGAAGGI